MNSNKGNIMDREDQLIGEILAARSTVQALCIALVVQNVVSHEALENQLLAAQQFWAKACNEARAKDPDGGWREAVASAKITEFIATLRSNVGGGLQ
jgi:hypothetical protein